MIRDKTIKSFEDLRVWKEAHNLTLVVYRVTRVFPKEEKFGLIAQVRRSASSVSANIAEGLYRNTRKEFLCFLYNARGSVGETISHLVLARDLDYLKKEEYTEIRERYERLARSLNALINSLKSKK